ncbi:hypothetical protein V1511DRAFT_494192 [Dipodascopsis uninucleata]
MFLDFVGSGKTGPLVIQQLMHYLPMSGSLTDAVPQYPPVDGSSTVQTVACRSMQKYREALKSEGSTKKCIAIPLASHVHNLIADSFHISPIATSTSASDVNNVVTNGTADAGKKMSPENTVTGDVSIAIEDATETVTGVPITNSDEINTICSICRYHFILQVSEHKSINIHAQESCFHHFVPMTSSQNTDNGVLGVSERFEFHCRLCQVLVTVDIRPPHLTAEIIDTFTPAKIAQRFEFYNENRRAKFASESIGSEMVVEPPVQLTPVEPLNCLYTLFRILKGPLEMEKGALPRTISVTNQAINTKVDSAILKHFYFTRDDEKGCFIPPSVNENTSVSNSTRQLLEESIMEIAIIVWVDGKVDNPLKISTESQITAIKKMLNCLNYDTNPRTIGYYEPTSPMSLRCASLGAIPDFSDSLLLQTFDRQNDCDPANSSYFLECLREISTIRQSEELQIRVVELQSLGLMTRDDLRNAYNELGVDDPESITDDNLIVGIYKARLQDSPSSASKLRNSLRQIAEARDSTVLKSLLQLESLDVEKSYNVLGVRKETEDEIIITSYEFNMKDSPNKAELLGNALTVIAKDRKSIKLLNFAESRNITGSIPDIDAAYSTLGIQNAMEDSHILTVYEIRVSDNPEEILIMRNALRAISNYRKSLMLKHYLETGIIDINIGPEVSENWPVGLRNIGNTCYLNSLLQFYFTVRPLRELVISFNDISSEQPLEAIQRGKRVGGRIVTEWEIERAQRFVTELSGLFRNLIESNESSVAPNYDLAYLALVSSKEEMAEQLPNKKNAALSETVLVESNDRTDAMNITKSDNKENADLSISTKNPEANSNAERNVLQEINIKKADSTHVDDVNAIVSASDERAVTSATYSMEDIDNKKTSPVVPERKISNNSSMMFGNQQDVTECIENVLFQIESALRPDRTDDDGEQIDLVKDLFFGKTKQTLELQDMKTGNTSVRTKEERFSHLIVDVATGPRDIYDALDSCFDAETVDLEGQLARRYVTISQLPPILQIQVQRVQYDREQGRVFKSNAPLNFEKTIYLDRYIDHYGEIELNKLRRETWGWKSELNKLQERREQLTQIVDKNNKLDAEKLLKATKGWLELVKESTIGISSIVDPALKAPTSEMNLLDVQSGLGDSEEDRNNRYLLSQVVTGLEEEIEKIQLELPKIDSRIEELSALLKGQFSNLRNLGYRIHSVFIHRGQATFGHYWIYIYDFDSGIFRKYNDERVTEVADEEVLPFSSDEFAKLNSANFDVSAATPYFLVFVREDLKDDLMESVKRVIKDKRIIESNNSEVPKIQSEIEPPNYSPPHSPEPMDLDSTCTKIDALDYEQSEPTII